MKRILECYPSPGKSGYLQNRGGNSILLFNEGQDYFFYLNFLFGVCMFIV